MPQGSSLEEDRDLPEDYRGVAEKLARRIEKLTGSIPGDHRKKTRRLTTRMSKAIGVAGWVYRCHLGFRVVDPPSLAVGPPIPRFSGYG
ncbi:hypothetical protein B296_00051761 [Ensete ventricosum]|uniref:Uncharacterized protein n=1 Tax=Ensete ventricosum TaxID=4639 RepID=A0A426XWG0_ENSVE|nr:hypothetical protein B296_00051761 [Ensete ventricosum]